MTTRGDLYIISTEIDLITSNTRCNLLVFTYIVICDTKKLYIKFTRCVGSTEESYFILEDNG